MRRDPLVAALVAAVFGVLWSQWAAMGLAGIAEAAVRVLGLVIGGALVGTAVVRLRRLGDARSARSMFRSRRYVGVVAAEFVAIGAGIWLLGTGSAHIVPWIALVVGVHFVVFAVAISRQFWAAAVGLLAAAGAAEVVLAAGGSVGLVDLVGGATAAAALFLSASLRLVGTDRRGGT
jgi:hypothetical protein